MVTFLKNCNNYNGQGRMMIFYHPRDGDCPMDGDRPTITPSWLILKFLSKVVVVGGGGGWWLCLK